MATPRALAPPANPYPKVPRMRRQLKRNPHGRPPCRIPCPCLSPPLCFLSPRTAREGDGCCETVLRSVPDRCALGVGQRSVGQISAIVRACLGHSGNWTCRDDASRRQPPTVRREKEERERNDHRLGAVSSSSSQPMRCHTSANCRSHPGSAPVYWFPVRSDRTGTPAPISHWRPPAAVCRHMIRAGPALPDARNDPGPSFPTSREAQNHGGAGPHGASVS